MDRINRAAQHGGAGDERREDLAGALSRALGRQVPRPGDGVPRPPAPSRRHCRASVRAATINRLMKKHMHVFFHLALGAGLAVTTPVG
jgi:hypothetical protein